MSVLELDLQMCRVIRLADWPGTHRDMALVGKFERVADQVERDLSDLRAFCTGRRKHRSALRRKRAVLSFDDVAQVRGQLTSKESQYAA